MTMTMMTRDWRERQEAVGRDPDLARLFDPRSCPGLMGWAARNQDLLAECERRAQAYDAAWAAIGAELAGLDDDEGELLAARGLVRQDPDDLRN